MTATQSPTAGASRSVDAARVIDADPTSTALLLAGPTAMDLWPGVVRLSDVGDRVRCTASVQGAEAEVLVSVTAPRRTPTAYVARFDVTGDALPPVQGEIVLHYEDGRTRAALRMAAVDGLKVPFVQLDTVSLNRQARRFLDNLAAAAEGRTDAA